MSERLTALLVRALETHLETRRPIRLPDGTQIIWNAFLDLGQARSRNQGLPNPIGYAEIDAYCRLMRIPLEPHHIRAITALDAAWLQWVAKPKEPLPDLSAAAFDARIAG